MGDVRNIVCLLSSPKRFFFFQYGLNIRQYQDITTLFKFDVILTVHLR